MPKTITTVEYSLLDALKVISKVAYNVNGCKTPDRFNIDDISSIRHASGSKIDFIFQHKNCVYQVKLNSSIAILLNRY
jgi:hypothetical protein